MGMSTEREPQRGTSSMMGVYRFCEKIGGRNAWFSRGENGDIVDFVIAKDGMSEALIVDQLAAAIYDKPARILSLMRPVADADAFHSVAVSGDARSRPSGEHAPVVEP